LIHRKDKDQVILAGSLQNLRSPDPIPPIRYALLAVSGGQQKSPCIHQKKADANRLAMSETIEVLNLRELETRARALLPQMAYDYYVSGANDEVTLRENRAAYERIVVLPHVLVDVSIRDMGTTVLGEPVSMPIVIAPVAFQRLAHPEGELATAKSACAAGTLMSLTTLSTCSIEETMAVTTGPAWFQLYVFKDREVTASLVKRAEAAGCKAIVLTVDVPFTGRRERDVRNRFTLPDHLSAKNLWPAGWRDLPKSVASSGMPAYVGSLFDATLNWKDLEWLAGLTKLPLLIKGILRPDDALRAVQHGAAGIIVSNHGGRQLDTTPASISVLPEIVDAVGGSVEVYVDGGIRRGTDVLKAVACGARAVLVGRPILWGLAVGGEAGVTAVLELLRQEFDLAMALSGCPTLAKITRDLVRSK
jgi:4-hydroxymandelate oxidase